MGLLKIHPNLCLSFALHRATYMYGEEQAGGAEMVEVLCFQRSGG